MSRRAASLPLLLLLAVAGVARAELVVLVGGHVFKVTSYEVEGERIRLDLTSGGRLTLSLSRVERIVDDEIVEPDEALATPIEPTRFSLAFDASHTAPDTPYGELIFEAARRHSLNPDLLAAIARAESAFDSGAVSRKGARGLLQLMPATAERFGVPGRELFDPRRNLEAASLYLVWLNERFDGDLGRVLAAYNAGEGAVEKYDGVPPYRETRTYVRRIFGYLGI